MAKKITELSALTTTAEDDLLVIEDVSTSTTKKITKEDFLRTITTDSITVSGTASAEGWSPLGATPNTITANGNRSYDLVFNSTDVTDTLSPGMRLNFTRTVTAPTRSTDLEGSSSQYYSKSSLSGMTFTDDFVVSAWIKLESYPASGLGVIASRYNGTSGWELGIDATGIVAMKGYNGGAANVSQITSYQAVPLNKWVHVASQLDMSAFTATTTTSYIMIDGVDVPSLVQRGGTNPTALIQAGNLEIGGRNGGLQPFDGKLAQVAIYSAKVTQATVKASMSQTLSGSETSLISAYSFNNSITDLNTSNANNLTANGSAVATNVDSPFAGGAAAHSGLTAGTTEFAEVVSATFSTNTTVVVRVPEGYLIPTSGGVSAVSYSTQYSPFGWPGLSNILGIVLLGSDTSISTSTTTAIPGLTIAATIPAGKSIRAKVYSDATKNDNAGGQTILGLHEGAVSGTTNQKQQAYYDQPSASEYIPVLLEYTWTPASTSVTINASYQTNGAGTTTLSAAFNRPVYLLLELV